ncbi:hypothetical protein Fcan01_26852 [Folsomia candida]|uniref:Uncharacterized protein n=1 Tax=Folsomia candida TaxID=158441 RepID=A0A226CYK9_FOLCA|nr:hypothetical protein Fcan01_26852 [Folsomia candida]
MQTGLAPSLLWKFPGTKSKESQLPAKFDLLGVALNNMVLHCSTLPFAAGVFAAYAELDPLYILIKYFPSPLSHLVDSYPWNYVSLTVRVLLNIVSTTELNRIAANVFCSFTIALHLIFSIISALSRIPVTLNMTRVRKTLTEYIQLNLIMTLLYDSFASTTAVMMSAMGVWCVMLNLGVAKINSIISMPCFILLLVSAIAAHLAVGILTPIGVEVYEGSKPIPKRWELQMAYYSEVEKVKWMRKRIRALRPLQVYFGLFEVNFFFLQQSTQGSYYEAIVNYTINAMLSVNV